jgi:hypothetical protein
VSKLSDEILRRVRLSKDEVQRMTGQTTPVGLTPARVAELLGSARKPQSAEPEGKYLDGEGQRTALRKMRGAATHMATMRILGYTSWVIAETYGVSDECVLKRLRQTGLTPRRPKGGRPCRGMLKWLPVRFVRD